MQQTGLGDFARAAAYSALQAPAVAISQILDKATGSKVAENLTLVNRPEEAEFGSVKWHAQQVGAAVGGLVPFLGALALTKNVSNATRAEELALAYSKAPVATTASMFRTGEMTVAGFGQGVLFEPNANKDQMFKERFTQGITGGVTMGSMHVLSNKLSPLTGASLDGASLLNKSLTTGIAGGASGLVGLKVDELLTGNRRSGEETAQSAYQAAFTGLALGGLAGSHLRLHQPADSTPSLSEFVARDKNFFVTNSIYLDHLRRSSTLWNDPKKPLEGASSPYDTTSLERFSPIEKAELVSILTRDADPLLRRPEVIKSFIDKVETVWNDDLAHRNEVYGAALDRAHTWQESLNQRPQDGSGSKQDGRDYAAIKRLLKKEDKKLDDLMDWRDEALEAHRQRLETAVNEFLAEQNLPSVGIKLVRSLETDASYGAGNISLNGLQFELKSAEPTQVNQLYHELTHLRQDTLLIRLLADKLGLPQHPTPEQVAQVRDEFVRQTVNTIIPGGEAEVGAAAIRKTNNRSIQELAADLDGLVDRVMALRSQGDPHLSEAETALAEKMTVGTREYRKQTQVQPIQELEEQMNHSTVFVNHDTPDLTATVLNQIVSDPLKFKTTYGMSSIPTELEQLAREHKQNSQRLSDEDLVSPDRSSPTPEQVAYYASLTEKVRPFFVKQLETMIRRVETASHERSIRYLSSDLERQAFPTGFLAEITHRATRESMEPSL